MSDQGSDGSTPPTLSRTVCALCRQRKTKCDRQLPRCGFCIKAKAPCQYLQQQQKRGLRAGYVSELESRIEALERQVEHLKRPGPSVDGRTAFSSQQTPAESQSLETTHSHPVDSPRPSRNLLVDTDAATADLMTLPLSYFYTLTELWFKEDHHWLPILAYEDVQKSLAALPDPVNSIPDVVLRALISLKIAYSSQAICLGYEGRRRLSLLLRSQTLAEAMSSPSLSSIQALFIIAVLDAGSDQLPSTMNIMSMCRRSGEHIGIFRQLLLRIESESPAQVGPPTKDSFASVNHPIALTWGILAFDAVSSLGVAWRDVSAALVDHLSSIAYLSTPDFRDSFRTHVHLCAIGLQPLHEFFFAAAKGEHTVLEASTLTTTEDIYQNLMSYSRGLPTSGYSLLADGAVDFDINHVFTRLLSHGATIMMYQRYVLNEVGETELARERCLDSYVHLVDIIRNISDADAEINSPMFAHLISVAARFKLLLNRAVGGQRDPHFDILMHGVNMCARRWPLARRIDVILRAAIAELEGKALQKLPLSFWDPSKSVLDISEALKEWVQDYRPSLYIGSMYGPYC